VEAWLEESFYSPGASPADDLAAAWIYFYSLVDLLMLHMIKKFYTYKYVTS